MAAVGKQFLIERAQMRRTTSYTEFNAALAKRSGLPGFDFDRDAGPGFSALARSKGLPVPATPADRQLFWAGHVGRVHQHYARR